MPSDSPKNEWRYSLLDEGTLIFEGSLDEIVQMLYDISEVDGLEVTWGVGNSFLIETSEDIQRFEQLNTLL